MLGLLYVVIGVVLVHALVFGVIYVYLGKVAAAAKKHPLSDQKELPYDQ